jgi:hypothetical protein
LVLMFINPGAFDNQALSRYLTFRIRRPEIDT